MSTVQEIRERVCVEVVREFAEISGKFKPFNSAHEGYGVLAEEVEELWEEIRKKRSMRDKGRMWNEAKQVAAVAMRFMVDLCTEEPPVDSIPQCAGETIPERRI